MWLSFIQNSRPEILIYFAVDFYEKHKLGKLLSYVSEQNDKLYISPIILLLLYEDDLNFHSYGSVRARPRARPEYPKSDRPIFSTKNFDDAIGYRGDRDFDDGEFSDVLAAEDDTDPDIFIYAGMDESVVVNRTTTLEVIVSGSKIGLFPSMDSCTKVVQSKPITVQAIAKNNYEIVGNNSFEIFPPKEEEFQQLYFDCRPTELGDGEVLVAVFQEQMLLLTLCVKSKIVDPKGSMKEASIYMTDGVIREYPKQYEPIHQLRIIEQQDGNRVSYRYELESPLLGILKSFESKTITCDRRAYIAALYEQIESRWISNSEDAEAFTQELRAFGGRLFDELFPVELQTLLWDNRQQIDSIMVLSTEPFIPWELIHLKQPGKTYLPPETCFLAQMGLVRWLYESGSFPPTSIRIRKACYIIPNYSDPLYRLPEAEAEAQFLKEEFDAERVEATASKFRSALSYSQISLLHFAGHGVAEQDNISNSTLMLEGQMGSKGYVPDLLSATTVSQFADLHHYQPLIVLNACQVGRKGYTLTGIGGFAEAFLKAGAGAFVGPLWSVGDKPARIFTESFYTGLKDGQKLAAAINAARQAAYQAGSSTWLAYAVYGHPNMTVSFDVSDK